MSTDDALGSDDQLDVEPDSGQDPTATATDSGGEPDTASTTTPDDEGADSDTPAAGPSLFDVLDQRGLKSFRDRYQSDAEAFDGLVEAAKAIGRRDEDAVRFKTLREKVGEERLTALLEGAELPTDSSSEPDIAELAKAVPSAEDFNMLMEAAAQPNAPEALRRRAEKARNAMVGLVHALGRQSRKPTAPPAELAKLKERFEALEKRLEESQRNNEVNQFYSRRANKIFPDGVLTQDPNQWTPLGRRMDKLYREHPTLQRLPHSLERMELAFDLAEASEPKPQPTRSASPGSRHQSSIAKPSVDNEALRRIMETHRDDENVLELLNNAVLESKGA